MTDTLTLDALIADMSRATRKAEQDYLSRADKTGVFDVRELHAAINRAALAAVAKRAGGKDALRVAQREVLHLAQAAALMKYDSAVSLDNCAALLRTLAEAAHEPR